MNLKVCSKCSRELPLDKFSKDGGANYLRHECRECANLANKKRKLLKEKYGYAPNNYRCPICLRSESNIKKPNNKQRTVWVLDHDHITDEFRGFLCHKCNLGIGNFNDDIMRLTRAISYLSVNSNEPL